MDTFHPAAIGGLLRSWLVPDAASPILEPHHAFIPSFASPSSSNSSSLSLSGSVSPLFSESKLSALFQLCNDAEGWGPLSPERDLDFSPCFQQAAFWIAPAVLLATWAAFELSWLNKLPERNITPLSRTLLTLKHAILLVVAAATVPLAIAPLFTRSSFNIASLAHVATLAAYLLAIPFQHANHLKTRRSSTALLFYELAHTLATLTWVRTYVEKVDKAPETAKSKAFLALFLARSVMVLIVFGIECAGVEVGQKAKASINPVSHQARGNGSNTYQDLQPGQSLYANGDSDTEGQPADKEADEANLDAPECPDNVANIWSRLSFWWMTPMMRLGASKFITENDLWALPPGEDAESLGDRFAYYLKTKRDKDGKPRFWTVMTFSFGGPFLFAGVLKGVQDMMSFIQPQILRKLLQFVQTWDDARQPGSTVVPDSPLYGFAIAGALFVVAVTQTAFLHQYFQRCFVTGMRVRAGLVSAIYRKSLILSNEERGARSTGEIVNLMSVDATRLQDLCGYGHIIWSALWQMTLAFVSLYNLLGWSAFAGVAVMVVTMPLNTALAKYMRSLGERNMKIKDKRTRTMNEILTNIKSIKLFAWEEAFTNKLFDIRNGEELELLRWSGMVSAFFNFFFSSIPFLVSLATFVTFASTSDRPLTADLIFPALSLYQLLGFPLAMFAGIVTAWIQALVSARRLADFLDAGELDPKARTLELKDDNDDSSLVPADAATSQHLPLVEIRNGDFKWSRDQPTPTLEGVDLTARKGELVAVLGKVGDGKSSLLSAILGEMHRSDGEVIVRGRTAYFTQGGWAMGASIRENILFGLQYEEDFYQRVLEACALKPDLEILPDGDQTEIGEKGVSLSGGQRARVALARACYARADIYLLDDPLAAVDAHVGAHIFKHVIGPEGMLKSKARILTTNSISYLPHVDQIVSFRRGVLMNERGTYEQVMAKKGDLYALITGLGKQSERKSDDDGDQQQQLEEDTATSADSETLQGSGSNSDEEYEFKLSRRVSTASMHRPKVLTQKQIKRHTMRQLREASKKPKEANAQGSVSWDVYKAYAKSASVSGWTLAVYFLAMISAQVLQVSRDLVLKQWGSYNDAHDGGDASSTRFYLGMYAAVGFGSSIAMCIAPLILFAYLVIASARHWHDSMFNTVLRAPLQWFEATPIGVSLNRFSKDVNSIDETLPRVLHGFFRTFIVVMGVMIVITVSVPPFLIAVVPLWLAYRAILRYYLATSRELKRLDAVSKSPIFSWFQESLGGLSSIRAFGQNARFVATSETRVDRNQQAYFPSVSTNRWLAVRIEFMGAVVILTASSLAVLLITKNISSIDAGLVGLMMSQALSTTQALNWVVRSASEVEQNIVSVERAIQYTELDSEAPYESTKDNAPPESWPDAGKIEFKDYSTKYRPNLPLVLKNLSLTIQPGERVGVVGRTGAGKSSLTLALFRIVEAAGGSIAIDGVDTASIGLRELRRSIAIIPQDASLWSGTLRDNLDPTGQSTDEELWEALDRSDLRTHVSSMKGGLDAELSEGASNFSAGQRQLICIARAIVRGAKILVMDEATSNTDIETDNFLQKSLREHFKDVTVIVIAHRLATIADADRIVVLDSGSIVEVGRPADLLEQSSTPQDEQGNKKAAHFKDMCEQSGDFDRLLQMARDARQKSSSSSSS